MMNPRSSPHGLFVLVLVVSLLTLPALRTHAAYPPVHSLPVSGPWTAPPIAIGTISTAPVNAYVESPPSLAGWFVHSIAPFTGKMFINMTCAAGEDCRKRMKMVLPPFGNTTLKYACTKLTGSKSNGGETLDLDTIVMVERGGGCSNFADKANSVAAGGAGAIMHTACSPAPPDNCVGTMAITLGSTPVFIPSPQIQYVDATVFRNYLLLRDAYLNGNTSLSAYAEPVIISFSATGPMVPEEKAAFIKIVQTAMTPPNKLDDSAVFPSSSGLRVWKNVSEPTLDPCLDRMYGIWCESGHLTITWLPYPILYGAIDPAWGTFTKLRQFEFSANGLSGPMPDTFCQMTSLRTLSVPTQSITSLPECLGQITTLTAIQVGANKITNFPSTLTTVGTYLQFLAIDNNKITTLPSTFSENLKGLYYFTLTSNPLTPGPLPSFSGWNNIWWIQIQNCRFTGSLDALAGTAAKMSHIDAKANSFTSVSASTFDNFPGLNFLDISFNAINTPLPNFAGSLALATLTLNNNAFTGGIPTTWASLQKVTTGSLQYNQLSGPMNALQSMLGLTVIQAHHNQIFVPEGQDVGRLVLSMTQNNLLEMHLDNNLLSGIMTGGYFLTTHLQILTLANNAITTLMPDMFTQATILQYDFTNNSLSGPFPLGTPRANTKLNLQGNPNLQVTTLPTWAQFSPDGAVVTRGLLNCAVIVGKAIDGLVIQVDPTFNNYGGCSCQLGKFGIPPLCATIPETAVVSPLRGFVSQEVGTDFTKMIQQGPKANVTNTTIPLPPPNLLLSPPGFSDQWYGSSRLTTGVSTTFQIDVRDLFYDTMGDDSMVNGTWVDGPDGKMYLTVAGSAHLVDQTDALKSPVSTPSTNIPGPLEDGGRYQPVRVLTIQLHISRDQFKQPSDIIFVYEGDATLQGSRVGSVVGTDTLPSPPTTGSSVTLTLEYQAQYGTQIAAITNRALIEINVLTNAASIHFQSRQTSGQSFFATYTYSFTCPQPDYFLDDTNDEYKCAPQLPIYKVGDGVRAAVWTIASLCIIGCLINAVVIGIKWDAPLYRAASRVFLLLMLAFLCAMSLGSMLFAAMPSYDTITATGTTLEDNGDMSTARAVCNGRVWLLGLPLAGILAILFGRANRVDKIFGSTSLTKVQNVSDGAVMQYIGLFCGCEIIFLSVFSGLKMSQPELTRGDGGRNDHLVWKCTMENGADVWLGLQIAYFACLMLVSAFVGFKTRNLPSAFNESSHILNTLGFIMFFSAILVPLDFYISSLPEAAVLLQGIGLACLVAMVIGIFYIPKLYIVFSLTDAQQRTLATAAITIMSNQLGHTTGKSVQKNSSTPAGVGGGSSGHGIAGTGPTQSGGPSASAAGGGSSRKLIGQSSPVGRDPASPRAFPTTRTNVHTSAGNSVPVSPGKTPRELGDSGRDRIQSSIGSDTDEKQPEIELQLPRHIGGSGKPGLEQQSSMSEIQNEGEEQNNTVLITLDEIAIQEGAASDSKSNSNSNSNPGQE